MKNFTSEKGFTLVELLVVVAMIAVLSLVVVPSFRRMVAKAKQSEAKVSLAGIFTAESAFFAEYGSYGNRINKIGFDVSSGGTRRYHVGFTNATCGNVALNPLQTNPAGASLLASFAPYYNDVSIPLATVSARPGAGTFWCNASDVAADGSTYIASATGNILSGVQASTPSGATCTTGCQDVWTIDQNRALTNLKDGVN